MKTCVSVFVPGRQWIASSIDLRAALAFDAKNQDLTGR
jgi:hypothetical protein